MAQVLTNKDLSQWLSSQQLVRELPNFFRTVPNITYLYRTHRAELERRGAATKTVTGRLLWHRQKTLDWYFNRPAK